MGVGAPIPPPRGRSMRYHQIGAALAAGVIRETFGEYTYAWWGGAALGGITAVLSIALGRVKVQAEA